MQATAAEDRLGPSAGRSACGASAVCSYRALRDTVSLRFRAWQGAGRDLADACRLTKAEGLLLLQETGCPSGVAPSKLVLVEISAAERPVVRGPGLDGVIGARERPAVPQGDVGQRVADGVLVPGEEGVGDGVAEEEIEIEATPTQLAGDESSDPYLWDGRQLRDLGTFGGDFGGANYINEAGDVVGFAGLPGDSTAHAFLWKHGAMTDLTGAPSSQCTFAGAINARDQIVGGTCDGSTALLWSHGRQYDLNTLVAPSNDQLTEAVFISDRGPIVALGVLPNGDQHLFLLTTEHGKPTGIASRLHAHRVSKAATNGCRQRIRLLGDTRTANCHRAVTPLDATRCCGPDDRRRPTRRSTERRRPRGDRHVTARSPCDGQRPALDFLGYSSSADTWVLGGPRAAGARGGYARSRTPVEPRGVCRYGSAPGRMTPFS